LGLLIRQYLFSIDEKRINSVLSVYVTIIHRIAPACLQMRWSKLPQHFFILAYIFNPRYRHEGLNRRGCQMTSNGAQLRVLQKYYKAVNQGLRPAALDAGCLLIANQV